MRARRETIERVGPCWLLKLRRTGRDSMSRYTRNWSFLGWFVGLVVPVQWFLFCLGCSSLPSTKYFIRTIHYSNSFVLIAELGGQAVVLGHLSLSMHVSCCSLILLRIETYSSGRSTIILGKINSRLAISVPRVFVPLVTKCTYFRIHINKGSTVPLARVTVMTLFSPAKRMKHNSFSFRHPVL